MVFISRFSSHNSTSLHHIGNSLAQLLGPSTKQHFLVVHALSHNEYPTPSFILSLAQNSSTISGVFRFKLAHGSYPSQYPVLSQQFFLSALSNQQHSLSSHNSSHRDSPASLNIFNLLHA